MDLPKRHELTKLQQIVAIVAADILLVGALRPVVAGPREAPRRQDAGK